MAYHHCTLCPRKCGVDRTAGKVGYCGATQQALVAKYMIHKWEEPVLAGNGGSGAIFFGGCSLGCTYCQNRAISQKPTGTPVDSAKLRQIMEELVAQGAENIDLVTPTHYLPTILPALETKLPVPVIYNCGGYENPETMYLLKDKVDIFLPDMKYADSHLAKALSGAKDYFAVASRAIKAMAEVAGPVQWDGDKVVSGVIIRHLILPGHVENSLKVLDWIADNFKKGEVLVSLMRQYTPMPGLEAPFHRPITEEEYQSVLSWMFLNDLEGFTQEESSSGTAYIPDF